MINMISMFSKIKNHALVTGYQNNNTKTNAQTSTVNTSTSTVADQSTSSTSTKSGVNKTATLNSISSNINSLQNAAGTTNYQSNDNLGKAAGQPNAYGRTGANASSKIRTGSPDHHSSSSSLHASMNLSSSKNSMLNSSGLSGSLGSGQQYSSAFPVSSFTGHTTQSYSANASATKTNAGNNAQQQLNMSALKQHRNSSVGLNTNRTAVQAINQQHPVHQSKVATNVSTNVQQINHLQSVQQSQNTQPTMPQQAQPIMQQQHSASSLPHKQQTNQQNPVHQSKIPSSVQQPAQMYPLQFKPQQPQQTQPPQQQQQQQQQQPPQQQQQIGQVIQMNQVNQMNNYNPFSGPNYQQQYMPNMPQQPNVSSFYNQGPQQYLPVQQPTQQLMASHVSPKHASLRQDPNMMMTNYSQPTYTGNPFIFFQQQQQSHQNTIQNQQPGIPLQTNLMLPPLLQQNKISQFFDIQNQVTGTAGPRLAWSIFSAIRKCDLKPASIFYFEKKSAERIHKPKRKDMVVEVLRREPIALDRFRHPRILNLIHPLEENADSLAYATEPVIGSLANSIGYLDEKQQNAKLMLHNVEITDFEIAYGLLQIIEALTYLQYSCNIIHRFVSPQSIVLNAKGTWKLAGFHFYEKCAETDITNPITTQPCTTRLPKICQPDIDFTAPEIQMHNFCNLTSDIYSFVILSSWMFNSGKPIMPSYWKCANYNRQVEMVIERAKQILPLYLGEFRDFCLKSLELDHRKRQNCQTFLMVSYFQQSGVQSLNFLDIVQFKDASQKTTFYAKLSECLLEIPKKLWWQHILPSIKSEIANFPNEMSSAALQPFLTILQLAEPEEVQEHMMLALSGLLSGTALRSVQAHVALLESLHVISTKLSNTQTSQLLWPMLFNALDSTSSQVQCAALNSVTQIIDQLDPYVIRKNIIPKTKIFFGENANILTQSNALLCIEKVIDSLNKTEILDDVLPMLVSAKSNEPVVLMPLLRIYKQMMCDKRYGLTVNVLATKVLPSLTPVVVSPNLKLDEFSILVDLLQEMLEHVSRNQRNKLKLEKFAPSCDKSQLHRTQDQPIGYPHRAPALRLDCRRTSISVDDVNRRPSLTQYQFNNVNASTNNSCCNSPDSNLLQVTQQLLPGRRHSDNTIQPPRILVQDMFGNLANTNGSRASSVVNLNILRRHSAAADVNANNSIYNAAFNPHANGINFTIPNFHNPSNLSTQNQIPSASRRYSMVNYGQNFNPIKVNTPNLFQTLGTGVQQLFGK